MEAQADLIPSLRAEQPTLTLSELRALLAERGIATSESGPSRFFRRHHITTARSKRSPCAWFSQLRLTDVAPYLSVDLLTPSDSLASAPPTR